MEDSATDDPTAEQMAEAARRLRIEAGEACARLAVAAFALLDTRAAAMQTLEQSRVDFSRSRLASTSVPSDRRQTTSRRAVGRRASSAGQSRVFDLD